jgi:hypothetical protein
MIDIPDGYAIIFMIDLPEAELMIDAREGHAKFERNFV